MTDCRAIYFDMDGTIADLYGNENWLADLRSEKSRPYRMAKSLVDMRALGKELNRLQRSGYILGIVSWLSKTGTPTYNAKVTKTKLSWLRKHLSAVSWDEIHIVPYGTPKSQVTCKGGILFDDEEPNRKEWLLAHSSNLAFDEKNILENLRKIY